MEKTFIEIQNEIEALLKAQHPKDNVALTHARFLGALLAWTDKATLEKLLTSLKGDN